MKSLILSAPILSSLLLTLATTAQAQYPPRDYPLRMEPDRGWRTPHYPSYRSANPLEDTWIPYRVPVRYAVVIRQEIMPTPNAPTKTPQIKPAAPGGYFGPGGVPERVAGLSIQIKSAENRNWTPVGHGPTQFRPASAACSSGSYPSRVEFMRISEGSAGWGLLRKLVIRIKIR